MSYEPTPEEEEALRNDVPKRIAPKVDIHRALPQSEEAEKGLICCFLLCPNEVGSMCQEKDLRPDKFHSPVRGDIFRRLMAMFEAQKPIDLVTLTQSLRDHNELDKVGGGAAVSEYFGYLPTAANFSYYLEIMEQKGMLREVIRIANDHAYRGYEEQQDAEALIESFEQAAMGIRKLPHVKRKTMRELSIEVVAAFCAIHDRNGGITGLSTGFPQLDRMTDGLYPQEMFVIAARPSHGKTAIAMNIVEHLALDLKKPVGVFSLEMSAFQLTQRLMCSRARVNYYRYRDGFGRESASPAITAAAGEIAGAPIYIEDEPTLPIQQIRAIARRMRCEQKIEALFIDYLQIARSNTRRAQENRQIEVSEISGGCKAMARELDIPVIVLAQVDRGVEKGGKQVRRPRASDLRESGSIEQDAATVAMLVRNELYAETPEERIELEGQASLWIEKQRHGPVGEVELTFLKEFTRFESRAREGEEEEQQTTFAL